MGAANGNGAPPSGGPAGPKVHQHCPECGAREVAAHNGIAFDLGSGAILLAVFWACDICGWGEPITEGGPQ